MKAVSAATETSSNFGTPDEPFGRYLVDDAGNLLHCNRTLRRLLGLPMEGPVTFSVNSFYCDPHARKEMLAELMHRRVDDARLESKLMQLCVNDQDLLVLETIWVVPHPNDAQQVAFAGWIVDITDYARHRRLCYHLPVGVYRLDKDDRIVEVNDALVKLLGYRSQEDLLGLQVRDVYAHAGEADEFKKLVLEKGSVLTEVRALRKRSGEVIFASISSSVIVGPGNSYLGREGTVLDVTKEEYDRRSLSDVPVCFYIVRVEDGRDIIRHCNQQFVELFEFESEDEVNGIDITTLYADPEDHQALTNKLMRMDTEQRPLLGHPLRVKTKSGRELIIEVNTRLQRDRSGQVIGRTGVVREISQELALRDEMKSLQNDIGRVLHAYTSTLIMSSHAVSAAIAAMSLDPFEQNRLPTLDQVEEELSRPTGHLLDNLAALVTAVEDIWHVRGVSEQLWNELVDLKKQIRSVPRLTDSTEFRLHVLRRAAHTAVELCAQLMKHSLPREPIKAVTGSAKELERVACLAALHQAEYEMIAMDHQVRALRDYVTTGTRLEEPKKTVQFRSLLRQTIANLEEFAHASGVDLRLSDNSEGALVSVPDRDVLRALGNLLHNAVKYSWSRTTERAIWVAIRAYRRDDFVFAEFENYGVPIPSDEIDEDLIFHLGFRGRLSADRGRLGTGIGLTDARNVARLCGGDVVVTSQPAWSNVAQDDYSVPYRTVVTFTLPVSRER